MRNDRMENEASSLLSSSAPLLSDALAPALSSPAPCPPLPAELRTDAWLLGAGSRAASAAARRRRFHMLLAGLGLQCGFVLLLAFGFFIVKPIAWKPTSPRIEMLYVPLPPAIRTPAPRRARYVAPRRRAPPRVAPPPAPSRTPRPVREGENTVRAAKPVERTPAAAVHVAPRPVPTLPVSRLELGRFGAPHGIRPDPAAPLPIAQLGGFGSAADPAADPPAAGQVAASGFGNALALRGEGRAEGRVRTAGFGGSRSKGMSSGAPARVSGPVFDAAAPLPPPMPASPPAPAPATFQPPHVLAWPQPVYTPAALQHHVQGEVLLRVKLRADGVVEVLEVEQGLGYGLDEAARRAARKIHFRPAQRGGAPVDWIGTVRIQFELAE